jgi:hypothetical protein
MKTEMETTEMTTAPKPSLLKTALAFAITLLFLFLVFYVVSRAWKKGQEVSS